MRHLANYLCTGFMAICAKLQPGWEARLMCYFVAGLAIGTVTGWLAGVFMMIHAAEQEGWTFPKRRRKFRD